MRRPLVRASVRAAGLAIGLAVAVVTALPSTAPAQTPAPTPAPPPGMTTAEVAGWLVGCFPDGSCRAAKLSESRGEILQFVRHPGADGYALAFETHAQLNDLSRPVDVEIDGRRQTLSRPRDYAAFVRPESFAVTEPKKARDLVAALLRARLLRLSYLDIAGRPFDAVFPLAGLDRALDWVDATGPKPPARRVGLPPPPSVPPAPAVDRAARLAAAGLPERLLARHVTSSACEDPQGPGLVAEKPVIGELSRTAMLYAVPCVVSAGRVSYRLYVLETGEIGGVTPLYFARLDPRFGWVGTDLLQEVAYDAGTRRLTAGSGGSGPGDCPWSATWTWDDFAFAMTEFRAATDCKGAPERVFPPR